MSRKREFLGDRRSSPEDSQQKPALKARNISTIGEAHRNTREEMIALKGLDII
jgi:hypothetical protein